MSFKIEKNVPLPTTAAQYPFDEMEIGDCFFIPAKDREEAEKKRSSVSGAASNRGFKVTTSVTSDDKPGVRVWLRGKKEEKKTTKKRTSKKK